MENEEFLPITLGEEIVQRFYSKDRLIQWAINNNVLGQDYVTRRLQILDNSSSSSNQLQNSDEFCYSQEDWKRLITSFTDPKNLQMFIFLNDLTLDNIVIEHLQHLTSSFPSSSSSSFENHFEDDLSKILTLFEDERDLIQFAYGEKLLDNPIVISRLMRIYRDKNNTNKRSHDENTEFDEEEQEPVCKSRKAVRFKCTKCLKVFCKQKALIGHMNSHLKRKSQNSSCDTTTKPLVCGKCNKSFKTKVGLANHSRTHINPSIPCTFSSCKCLFKTRKQMLSHRRIHQDSDVLPQVSPLSQPSSSKALSHDIPKKRDKFICPICDLVFHSAKSLNNHKDNHFKTQNQRSSQDKRVSLLF